MLKLRFYPDPMLKRVAQKVTRFDWKIRKHAEEMSSLMFKEEGIGLAAPQVGLSIRLIICHDPRTKQTIALVNPEILSSEGEQVGPEGCLSFPDLFREVKRPEKVTVKYHDVNGKIQTLKADGILARCICHEIDHLDGILFISR